MSTRVIASKNNRILVWGLGGAAALFAIALALATQTDTPTNTSSAPAFGRVMVVGDPLPVLPETGQADPAIDLAIPALAGADFERSRVEIVPDDGRPKLLIGLAHWCPHCQNEVPPLQDWVDAGGGKGVDLYSIVTFTDPKLPNYPPAAWLENEGWTIPVLLDDREDSAATALGGNATPFFVFVRSDGTVAYRTSGELPVGELDRMLAEITR